MPRAKKNPLEEGIQWAKKVHTAWDEGTGSAEDIQQGIEQINRYLKPLASPESGDPTAAYWLGLTAYKSALSRLISETGIVGEDAFQSAEENFCDAEDYFKTAIARSDSDEFKTKFKAMLALASVYELQHLIGGVDRSQEALDMKLTAAQGDCREAQLHVALAYYFGEALPKSMSQSRFWIEKAKHGKDELPKRLRHELEELDEMVAKEERPGLLMGKSPRFILLPRSTYKFD